MRNSIAWVILFTVIQTGCSFGRKYEIGFEKRFSAEGVEVKEHPLYNWKTQENVTGKYNQSIFGNIKGRKIKEFIAALEKLNFLFSVESIKKAEVKP